MQETLRHQWASTTTVIQIVYVLCKHYCWRPKRVYISGIQCSALPVWCTKNVKFFRVADATSILSKRSSRSTPVVIKPDMSPTERRVYLVRSSRSVAPVHLSGTNFTVESQSLLSLTSRSVFTTLFLLKTAILLAVRYTLWMLLLTLHHSCLNPKLSFLQWHGMKVIPQLASKIRLLYFILSLLLPPLRALLPLQSMINDYQISSIFVT